MNERLTAPWESPGNRGFDDCRQTTGGRFPSLSSTREGATTWRDEPVIRSFHLGTMSSHTMVRKEAVIPCSVDIPFTSACIIGCGVMTGYGSVVNPAKVTPGSSTVVLDNGATADDYVDFTLRAEHGNGTSSDHSLIFHNHTGGMGPPMVGMHGGVPDRNTTNCFRPHGCGRAASGFPGIAAGWWIRNPEGKNGFKRR